MLETFLNDIVYQEQIEGTLHYRLLEERNEEVAWGSPGILCLSPRNT